MSETIEPPKLSNDEIIGKLWMVRPCQIYHDEFKECSSMRGRFHQKYTSGDVKECWQWKQDHTNCLLFEKTKDFKHLESVVKHEEDRRKERLAGANGNNVWEYRTHPPEDWEKPVPSKLTKTFGHLDEAESKSSKSSCAGRWHSKKTFTSSRQDGVHLVAVISPLGRVGGAIEDCRGSIVLSHINEIAQAKIDIEVSSKT